MSDSKIWRDDLDAAGKPCHEGFYAVEVKSGRLLLMPPTAELAAGLRIATQAEVDRGGAVAADASHIANCDPCPSDRSE